MAKDALIFTTPADAQDFQSTVDADAGYPAVGVDIGGGVHVPAAQSMTLHESDIISHPTLPQWAVQLTPKMKGKSKTSTHPHGSAGVLDATWVPAPAAKVIA